MYPPDPGAGVPVLCGPCGGGGLSVPVSLHHDRSQLLLLHVCGPTGLPGEGSVSIALIQLIDMDGLVQLVDTCRVVQPVEVKTSTTASSPVWMGWTL